MGEERKGSQAPNKYSPLTFQGNGLINSAKGTASYFNSKLYMPGRAARARGAEEPKATVPGERLSRCSGLMGNEAQGTKLCSSPAISAMFTALPVALLGKDSSLLEN